MDLDGLTLEGLSIGGHATALDLPELKVAVDVGQCFDAIVARDVVLITHAHADHLGSIVQHVAQRGMRRLPPSRYIVPPGVEAELEELLRVWRRLDGGELRAEIVSLAPGERLRLRRDLDVVPFRTDHRVVSQGYHFFEVRERLRDELRGASGEELARRRAAGEAVGEEVRDSLIAITGDTRFDGVAHQSDVLSARRLVMEATFLDDAVPPDLAREKGHVHLDEIVAAADDLQCEVLVLNHFSTRYSREDVDRILAERLPDGLRERVRVMVGRH